MAIVSRASGSEPDGPHLHRTPLSAPRTGGVSVPDPDVLDRSLPKGTAVIAPIVTAHFDGACQTIEDGRVATYGFTIEGPGLAYEESGLALRPFSEHSTNNVAEYVAAIHALDWLRSRPFTGHVVLMGDSQLVIRQMLGEYEVRTAHLLQYRDHLRSLAQRFSQVQYVWVPREENRRADALSKLALEDAIPVATRLRREAGTSVGGFVVGKG